MGEIIHLRLRREVDLPRPASTEPKTAGILLFTGVRYQRYEQPDLLESATDSGSPPKGGMDGAGRGKRKRRG